MTAQDALTTAASRRFTVGTCPACRRRARLTFHHLIPRKMHRRPRFRNHYRKTELGRGIYVCRLCHDGIHQRFDELTLATHYSDPARLLKADELRAHFHWVSRQKEDWQD